MPPDEEVEEKPPLVKGGWGVATPRRDFFNNPEE